MDADGKKKKKKKKDKDGEKKEKKEKKDKKLKVKELYDEGDADLGVSAEGLEGAANATQNIGDSLSRAKFDAADDDEDDIDNIIM